MSKYRIVAQHADGYEYTADTLAELNEVYREWVQYSMNSLRQLNWETSQIDRITREFQAILMPYWESQSEKIAAATAATAKLAAEYDAVMAAPTPAVTREVAAQPDDLGHVWVDGCEVCDRERQRPEPGIAHWVMFIARHFEVEHGIVLVSK